LADASDLIESPHERRISLDALLSRALKPYVAARDDRFYSSGPNVDLEPRLALALLIFHELVTNACKYGALASLSGRVEIHWSLQQDAAGRKLALQWRERDGPEVCGPRRSGFGLNLVTKVLADAEVELRFERTGVVCQMLIEIDKFSC
jgi:two-component sensor histidine kinase